VSFGQIGDKEERYCCPALFCSLRSSSRSNIFLGLLCVELENLVSTKVVEYFSTFLTNSYLHFCILGVEFCKFAVSYYQFQNSVNMFSFEQHFNIA
jgi:hypothetical protein